MGKQTIRWEEDDEKIFAFLAVFLNVIGIILALIGKKNNHYVMYYVKQSFMLLIFGVIIKLSYYILELFNPIGKVITISAAVIWVCLWGLGSYYALSGKKKPIPLLGNYAESLKF